MKKAPMKTSLGRKKLETLGIKLPTLPTSSVGSFPKPTELMELRYKVFKGVQQHSELDRKERLSTEIWIKQQERLSVDVMVDGEMNRGDMISYFARKLAGFEVSGMVRICGNRYYAKPVVKGKIEWKSPITTDMWKLAQRMTHRPVKALITGPFTMMDWSFNDYYPTQEALCHDLTHALRCEVENLVEAGAKIIQIDESALSSSLDKAPLAFEAIKEITRGVKAYFILHQSYGNVAAIWDKMQRLPVDNFSIEMANSKFNFLSLLRKLPTTKDVSLGVINPFLPSAESSNDLRKQIQPFVKVLDPSQIWITADSGLKTMTTELAVEKLKSMMDSTLKLRKLVR